MLIISCTYLLVGYCLPKALLDFLIYQNLCLLLLKLQIIRPYISLKTIPNVSRITENVAFMLGDRIVRKVAKNEHTPCVCNRHYAVF